MAVATSAPMVASTRRPLFRGYALVVFVSAWLLGDWLSGLSVFAVVTPVAWLAGAVAGLALSGAAGLLARRILLGSGVWGVARVALALGALLFWLGLGAARSVWADPVRDPRNIAHDATGAQAQVIGQVVDQPDERDGYRLLTVQVSAVSFAGASAPLPATGYVEATVYGPNDWFSPAYGDTVRLTGALRPVSGGAAPTSVTARMSSARVSITARGGGWPPLATLFQLRVALAQAIERTLPEPEAALLIGILLGLKSPALRARLPFFVNTGTIHLVVPAGLKVSLLAEFASRAARRFGVWPRTVAALLAVGVYAALGGGGPAAVRAAIMGALLALAPALGRVYNVYTALALATFIMTLIEPALLYDAGFQLTVLATFALPLLTPALQQALLRPLGRFARLAVTQTITESLAVTLAAQAATLPTLALTFHVVSLVAPLANLLTVPLLAPLLTLGGLLALLAALGWSLVALALAWVVWPLLWWVNAAIAGCAALPLAALQTPPAPALLAAVYYAALIALILALAPRLAAAARALPDHHQRQARHPLVGRALVVTLGLALLGSLGAAAPALAAQREAQLVALDVGPGGSALLLRLPDGRAMLIDGGPSGPALESALASHLPFWQRTLDVAVLTDVRAGDARGLEDAASHFTIGHALDAGMAHPNTEYLAYLDAMRRAGATRQRFRAGNALHLDATTTLTALAPPQSLYPPNEGDTTASDNLILRLETPGLRALLLGAADAYALDALAGSGQLFAADVVVVAAPRGAPLYLSGPLGDVLRQAHPQALIITDAPVSTQAHKGVKLTADMWASDADVTAATGAQVYRLSDTGALALTGDVNGWTLG